MIILDGTIVTVALPSIQRSLRFTQADLTWVVNSYLIALGGLLLLAGRLGDLLGRKRMFLAGLALFTTASLLCGVATTSAVLIVARFVQGAGAAMVSAVALGMIVMLFPEPRERDKAIAVWSFVGAVGASVGLILGGVLTQTLNWHWIFFVNLPVGVLALGAAVRFLDRDRGLGLQAGADGLGAVLVTAGLMLGVYAIVETTSYGWASARTLGTFAVAVILLAAFVARQTLAATPLLPLRVISPAIAPQVLVIAAAYGFQVLITLYMQQVLGYGPAASGLGLFPTAAAIAVVSLGLSARLIGRFGPRTVLLAGLILVTLALVLLTGIRVHGGYATHVLPAMLIFGIGGGLVLPAVAGIGMAAATPEDAGIASGLLSTAQQVGAALGVAVLSTLAASRTLHLTTEGRPLALALTDGYRLAFAVGAGLALIALAVSAAILRRPGASRQPRVEPAPKTY
jgi:EmrB/QacA subfamily drug resistance transporter